LDKSAGSFENFRLIPIDTADRPAGCRAFEVEKVFSRAIAERRMLGNLHPLQPGGIFMKAIIILALAASLGLTLAASSTPVGCNEWQGRFPH
jgi:hypothetical protein